MPITDRRAEIFTNLGAGTIWHGAMYRQEPFDYLVEGLLGGFIIYHALAREQPAHASECALTRPYTHKEKHIHIELKIQKIKLFC